MDQLERWLCGINPARRRRFALWMLVITTILGHLNIAAWAAGLVSPEVMDAITNYLSWFALILTAATLVAAEDVRVEQ